MDYTRLATEGVNPATVGIDLCETEEILQLIHAEDQKVIPAVGRVLPEIALAVDRTVAGMRAGGRLIYVGAGTSGRLGVLDASECPPTFGTSPEQVVGLIAGGDRALRSPVEGAEDDEALGQADMDRLKAGRNDMVVGVTASGNAPYVLGAVRRAKERGAATTALCCARPGAVIDAADIAIVPVVGPEVIMGSTRMKAGTAGKLVLNMLSTAVMVRLGKVYQNLMVDLEASNRKLRDRAVRIIMEAVGVSRPAAEEALREAGGALKPALLMLLCGCSLDSAESLLEKEPNVRRAQWICARAGELLERDPIGLL